MYSGSRPSVDLFINYYSTVLYSCACGNKSNNKSWFEIIPFCKNKCTRFDFGNYHTFKLKILSILSTIYIRCNRDLIGGANLCRRNHKRKKKKIVAHKIGMHITCEHVQACTLVASVLNIVRLCVCVCSYNFFLSHFFLSGEFLLILFLLLMKNIAIFTATSTSINDLLICWWLVSWSVVVFVFIQH